MSNLKNFINHHQRYYQILEEDFIKTLRYVELSRTNFSTYSIEYVKQLQSIGSEIDVLLKYYCELIEEKSVPLNIVIYSKVILANKQGFSNAKIYVDSLDDYITPWSGWFYRSDDKYGFPFWWDYYNDVKQKRLCLRGGNKNFLEANLKTVLFSLAALYILNEFIYRDICRSENKFYGERPNVSKLFTVMN